MSEKVLDTENEPKQTEDLIAETSRSIRINEKPELSAPSQWNLSCLLIKSAAPTLVQLVSQTVAFSTILYFLSLKNDPKLLASFGLASTIYVITFFSIVVALDSGLAILGSQAYGAKNFALLGLYYKKGLIIGVLTLCPMAVLFIFSGQILILCRFEEELSHGIQKVLLVTLPSALGMVYFDVAKNYLIAQKTFVPQGYIQIIMTVIDITCQYLTMYHFDLKIVGYGISRFINEWGRALLIYLYIRFSKKCQESQVPWSFECFRGILKQYKYQITAGGTVIIEILAIQIIILQTAYFSSEEIAAGLIFQRIGSLFFNVVWSFNIALSSFIGNSMGEQNIVRAKALFRLGLKFTAIMTITTWIILKCYSDSILKWFSQDQLVIKPARQLIILYYMLCVSDFTQNVLGCTVRSIGKEKVISKSFFFTYYFFAFPVSLLMAHVLKWKLLGLFGALGLAQIVNCTICTVILLKVDFQEQAQFIVNRVKQNSVSSFNKFESKELTEEAAPETSPRKSAI